MPDNKLAEAWSHASDWLPAAGRGLGLPVQQCTLRTPGQPEALAAIHCNGTNIYVHGLSPSISWKESSISKFVNLRFNIEVSSWSSISTRKFFLKSPISELRTQLRYLSYWPGPASGTLPVPPLYRSMIRYRSRSPRAGPNLRYRTSYTPRYRGYQGKTSRWAQASTWSWYWTWSFFDIEAASESDSESSRWFNIGLSLECFDIEVHVLHALHWISKHVTSISWLGSKYIIEYDRTSTLYHDRSTSISKFQITSRLALPSQGFKFDIYPFWSPISLGPRAVKHEGFRHCSGVVVAREVGGCRLKFDSFNIKICKAKWSLRSADSVCSLRGVHKTKVRGFKIHSLTPINPLASKDLGIKIK